jgi:hypothetical protein
MANGKFAAYPRLGEVGPGRLVGSPIAYRRRRVVRDDASRGGIAATQVFVYITLPGKKGQEIPNAFGFQHLEE